MAVRLIATLFGGANALLLLVVGGMLGSDDIIFGDLGVFLMLAGLGMFGLLVFAWAKPAAGGAALLLLGGVALMFGFAFTPQAGVLLGGSAFVAGLLFVWTRPVSD